METHPFRQYIKPNGYERQRISKLVWSLRQIRIHLMGYSVEVFHKLICIIGIDLLD